MAITHRINLGWGSGGESLEGNKNYTADLEVNADIPVAATTTDKQAVVPIDVSEIQSIILSSDVDMKVETNDGTTPNDTIDLVADVPYIWTTDSYDTCLLTVDVTDLYLTNDGSVAGTLKVRTLVDSTP